MWDRAMADHRSVFDPPSNPPPAAAPRPLILVVDDEPDIQRVAHLALSALGYGVVLGRDGLEGLELASQYLPDLVLADAFMPKLDGREMCGRLKSNPATSGLKVVIMTALYTAARYRSEAFRDFHADDYLSKPFSAGELLARVRALLRRSAGQSQQTPLVRSGDLEVDLARRAVRLSGEDVLLTPIEYDVLSYLAQNANCVVRRGEIARRVWGRAGSEEAEALRVHVSHIRRKIENASDDRRFILTEPGVGYRFLAAD
jgi:two-component system KDP operon response regulator KdpE